MADTIEKKIDIPTWWSEGKKTEYKNNLLGKEIGKTETIEERKQAEKLLENIENPEQKTEKKEQIPEKKSTLPPEIQNDIDKLNRPDAAKGIAQAYTNIDETIKNSKNEKGIAGFLGKIMNKILG